MRNPRAVASKRQSRRRRIERKLSVPARLSQRGVTGGAHGCVSIRGLPFQSAVVNYSAVKVSRLVGLPLAVLVLHLGVVANESKCRIETTARHAHHGAGQQTRSESTDHRTHSPAIPLCCQALSSCSATVGLAENPHGPAGPQSGPNQIFSAPLAHGSVSSAPEAPPPRA